MLLHLLHAVLVVAIVMAFPCGMAALVCKLDDGGTIHRAD